MSKFIIENWKNLVAIVAVIWSAFCFVYILQGLPSRMNHVEQVVLEYQMEKLPPRVTNLETDVKGLEKEIYSMKADVRQNYTMSVNTYTLVKELRDHVFLRSSVDVYKK